MLEDDKGLHKNIESAIKPPLRLPTRPKVEIKFAPTSVEMPVSEASRPSVTSVSHTPTLLRVAVQATPVEEIPTALMATVPTTPVATIPPKLKLTLKEKSGLHVLKHGVKSGPHIAQNQSRFSSNLIALEKFATIRMRIITSTLYKNTSTIVGPLQEGNEIHYKNVFSQTESWTLRIFIKLITFTTFGLIIWML